MEIHKNQNIHAKFSNKMPILILVSYILWLVQSILVFFYAPIEVQQGIIQKIFYYHVPTAWVSFVAFFMVFFYSIRYLKTKEKEYEIKAYTHTLIGWIFTSGVIITGPLWAKPIWGHFWNWNDQRLMTFFILWITYAVYILLYHNMTNSNKKGSLIAIIGIIAFINVPLVYFSIRIWNTPSHPGPVINGETENSLNPQMRLIFWYSVICFSIFYILLVKIFQRHLLCKESIENYRKLV